MFDSVKKFVRVNAKALAALASASVYFVLTDGKDASELEEAIKAVVFAFVVWLVPNEAE